MAGSSGRRVLGSPPPCSPELGGGVTSCSFPAKGEPDAAAVWSASCGDEVSLVERWPAPAQRTLRFPQKQPNLVRPPKRSPPAARRAWTRVRGRGMKLETHWCASFHIWVFLNTSEAALDFGGSLRAPYKEAGQESSCTLATALVLLSGSGHATCFCALGGPIRRFTLSSFGRERCGGCLPS